MKPHPRPLSPLALIGCLVACDGPSSNPPSESTADSTVPRWEVEAKPLATIGRVEGPEEELLSRVTGAALLPDGGVAIADAGSGSVRLFEADGDFRLAFGRPGEGPGEFGYISGLRLVSPDRLRVFDADAQRLSTFTLEGELDSSLTLRASTGFPELDLGQFTDGTHAAIWIERMGRDPGAVTSDRMAVGRFGADGQQEEPLTAGEGMLRLRTESGGGPLPFSPHFLAARVGDTLFVTDGRRPEIRAIDAAGELVRSIPVPVQRSPPEAAREDLAAALPQERRAQLADLSVPEMDSIPFLAELLTDPTGRLWVKPYVPATDSHWRGRARTGGTWIALATDGEVLARIEIPGDLRLLAIDDTRIVGVAKDDLGVERVRIHAVAPVGSADGRGR
jgi:hypothetical protein